MGLLAALAQDADKLDTPPVDWSALAPILVLMGGAIVLLVVGSLLPRKTTFGWHAFFTISVACGAIGMAVPLWNKVHDDGAFSVVADSVGVDGFSVFFTVVICVAVVIASLLLDGYLRREDLQGYEPYVLLLLSASGGVIMASANDLIVLFLGLEILSIAVYVLAGMHVRRARSGEAAMKYFVLGAFSSAFFLYGIAMVYGATGSTNLIDIRTFLIDNVLTDSGLLLVGFALLLVGFGFKIAAVPFHSWAPDVYQGSPTPIVSFMASGVKAAGFAGLLRVFYLAFGTYRTDWQPIIYAIAVMTLLVGAFLAVVQTDVKRMLAYSSINHAGFVLLGVQAGTAKGVSASLFYLAVYTFMVAGSFGVVSLLGRKGDGHHRLDHYSGLARREPLLALALTVFLLAQAGVPPTGGFLAKFYVLTAAVDANSYWLALIAMLSAVVSAYLYLRIVLAMYSGTKDTDEAAAAPTPAKRHRVPVPAAAAMAIVLALVGTLGIGILPDRLSRTADDAVPELVSSGGR